MVRKIGLAAALAAMPASALAQAPVVRAGDSGDSAWILVCAALVLLMTLPVATCKLPGETCKLDLSSRAQAIVFAYEHGLARPGR